MTPGPAEKGGGLVSARGPHHTLFGPAKVNANLAQPTAVGMVQIAVNSAIVSRIFRLPILTASSPAPLTFVAGMLSCLRRST